MSLEDAYLAVRNDDVELLLQLCKDGVDVNALASDHLNLLYNAVDKENIDLIRILLEHKANPNALVCYILSPLNLAISKNNLEITKLLIEKGADVNLANNGMTPLLYAVKHSSVEICYLLIESGADINATDPFNLKSGLHYAVELNDVKKTRMLLEHKAKVNVVDKDKYTPLHSAIMFSTNIDLLDELIKFGADLYARDHHWCTLLHWFISQKHTNLSPVGQKFRCRDWNNQMIFKRLLKYGADVNGRSNFDETALHLAASYCDIFCVKELLSYGAEVNVQNKRKESPLHLATKRRHATCVEVLLNYGADVNLPDNSGRTPIEYDKGRLKKIFSRHLVKMSAAGLVVMPIGEEGGNFANQCAEEIKNMKLQRFFGSMTLYNFLGKHSRGFLARLAMKPKVIETFGGGLSIRYSYPIYAEMLQANYQIGTIYGPILEKATQGLEVISGYHRSKMPFDTILDFLNLTDLQMLNKATVYLLNKR